MPLDHVVIAVHDLPQAMADYCQLGFQVLPGGKHPGRESSNALIVFADGAYLELIAWAAPNDERWYKTLQTHGEGLMDFALLPHDTMAVLTQALARGLDSLHGPVDGGRVRPDGRQLRWRSARSSTGDMPFLCGDITPRPWRVPDAHELCKHANGALGIAGLTVRVADLPRSVARYRALVGDSAVTQTPDRPNEAQVNLLGAAIQLVQPPEESDRQLTTPQHLSLEGPRELRLRNATRSPHGLDPRLTHSARIRWH